MPYVTSFATIGIIWLNHHAMFYGLERVEHTTLTLNLLLLLVVAFIPYPTAALSRYGALPTSALLYGAVLTLLGIAYFLFWWHIVRRGLSSSASDKADARRKIRRNLMGPAVYSAATHQPLPDRGIYSRFRHRVTTEPMSAFTLWIADDAKVLGCLKNAFEL